MIKKQARGELEGKLDSFTDRLEDLRLRRNEARSQNFEQVNEECKRNNMEKNFETKKARAEAKLKKIEDQKEAETKGESYNANVRLTQTALEIDDYNRKRKKSDADPGFSDYAACHLRRYNKNIRLLQPDLEKYEKIKASGRHVIDTSGPGVLDLFSYSEPPDEAVEKVVNDVKKQRERREKLSRRRPYNPDIDIDYINERNRRYNIKTQQFYGKYSQDIKNDLERGTAL
ncbi:Pre-mRNA-splicing factor syf2 [Thelohanellus kitauei]|uniref:Pre-mRNA-splicing factor SYF2 n=1 Tax=Thelohanellus kitauei TaxID=669202 RepID=A0A0C2J6R4_THEKT|nr:Pre-mRNA-splicing factor syf2 [Thelohanellus kitauei]